MIKAGDIVRILPEFYLQYAPMPVGVVERLYPAPLIHNNGSFLVGFVMNPKKLWLTLDDVEIVGHVDE